MLILINPEIHDNVTDNCKLSVKTYLFSESSKIRDNIVWCVVNSWHVCKPYLGYKGALVGQGAKSRQLFVLIFSSLRKTRCKQTSISVHVWRTNVNSLYDVQHCKNLSRMLLWLSKHLQMLQQNINKCFASTWHFDWESSLIVRKNIMVNFPDHFTQSLYMMSPETPID